MTFLSYLSGHLEGSTPIYCFPNCLRQFPQYPHGDILHNIRVARLFSLCRFRFPKIGTFWDMNLYGMWLDLFCLVSAIHVQCFLQGYCCFCFERFWKLCSAPFLLRSQTTESFEAYSNLRFLNLGSLIALEKAKQFFQDLDKISV